VANNRTGDRTGQSQRPIAAANRSDLRVQPPAGTLTDVPNRNVDVSMYARVMTSSPKPGAAETAIADWPRHIGVFREQGLVAGYLFFDRAANQFLSITIWESEEAQIRNASSPEQIYGRAEFMKHLTTAPVASTYSVVAVVE
jgi:heme-degrading monooxygenase HmoA